MTVYSIVILPNQCRGCRSCQLACSFVRHGVFNPSKSVIMMERDVETEHMAPAILARSCDLCSGDPACVKACPYGAMHVSSTPSEYKILIEA
ncbi:MAG: 4Fe-4S dicluster domain-containing protein [Anaerolineales bacterium]|jgi:Fe-S-cluster-containing dehydrogenase component